MKACKVPSSYCCQGCFVSLAVSRDQKWWIVTGRCFLHIQRWFGESKKKDDLPGSKGCFEDRWNSLGLTVLCNSPQTGRATETFFSRNTNLWASSELKWRKGSINFLRIFWPSSYKARWVRLWAVQGRSTQTHFTETKRKCRIWQTHTSLVLLPPPLPLPLLPLPPCQNWGSCCRADLFPVAVNRRCRWTTRDPPTGNGRYHATAVTNGGAGGNSVITCTSGWLA